MIILDFEASGLHPDSYPIEVAWYNMVNGECDDFLIKPTSYWTYWDENAEHIHGINQGTLLTEGLDVYRATLRLKKAISSQSVYSDAPGFDEFWLRVLFDACEERIPFPVKSVYELVRDDQCVELSLLLQDAERPHRALNDCKVIAEAVRTAQKLVV